MESILRKYYDLGLAAGLEPESVLPILSQLLEYRKLLVREMIKHKHVSTEKEFNEILEHVNIQIKKLLIL